LILAQQARSGIYDKVLEDAHAGELGTALNTGNAQLVRNYYNMRHVPLVNTGELGNSVAAHYAGEHKNFMAAYARAMTGPLPADPEGAIQAAYDTAKLSSIPVSTGARGKELLAAVEDKGMLAKVAWAFDSEAHNVVNPTGLRDLLAQHDVPNLPAEDVLKLVKHEGKVSVIGGYHWQKPVNATRLDTWLDVNKTDNKLGVNEVQQATRRTIDRLRTEGGIEGPGTVYQKPDVNGVPQFYIMGMTSGNSVRILPFSASTINADWEVKTAPIVTSTITNRPDPDAPSIYSSTEEWAAYRKRQSTK
jgi:hypothetical protein